MADNHTPAAGFSHEKIETNNLLLITLTLVVVLFGGLVEIVPLFFQRSGAGPQALHPAATGRARHLPA